MMNNVRVGIDARMYGDRFTGIGHYNVELTNRLFALTADRPGWEWRLYLAPREHAQWVATHGDRWPQVTAVVAAAKHYSVGEQTSLWWQLQREKCDLVHFTNFNGPVAYRGRKVVTIHDLTLAAHPPAGASGLKLGAYRGLITHMINTADCVVTVSDHTAKDVLGGELLNTKIDQSKVRAIKLGGPKRQVIDPTVVAEVRAKYGLGGRYVLYMGNWKPHKNLPRLVQAFDQLADTDLSLELVLTGKPTGEDCGTAAAIAQSAHRGRIKPLGYIDRGDIAAVMAGAAVYGFPSLYEGFGLPALDALAVGTPVAAAGVSSLPEVCGEAARYFDPLNVDEMAAVIGSVLNDNTVRRALTAAAERQLAQYDWGECAEVTLGVYEAVLEGETVKK